MAIPKLRGNVTRKLKVDDPSGRKVVVALTYDRSLDSRVLDYLAKTLTVGEHTLSSAELAAWNRSSGTGTMGWIIAVAITSPAGHDVSKLLVRPPPGIDLVRPSLLRPSDELIAGLQAHPRAVFPERTVPRTVPHAHGGTSITITGTITCQLDSESGAPGKTTGDIRDAEVTINGIAASWTSSGWTATGPFHAPSIDVRVRYTGRVSVTSPSGTAISAKLDIVDDGGSTRFADARAMLSTSAPITVLVPAIDCEAWRHGHGALSDYVSALGAAPPAGGLAIRRQGGVWPETASAYAHYDTIVLPTQWLKSYASMGYGRMMFHEFGHTVRHVADGDIHHWHQDLARYSYVRTRATFCELFNRGFAFNEGWARYWAVARGGETNSNCSGFSSAVPPPRTDWTESMVAFELKSLADAVDSNPNEAARKMVSVLTSAKGAIHTLRDFEQQYCRLFASITSKCRDQGVPVRDKPANCPPEFNETADHCHFQNDRLKPQHPRGAASAPNGCGAGLQYIAGLCYSSCPSGYTGVGPACWQDCPSGWPDDGGYCRKAASYGRGVGYGWLPGDKPWSLEDAHKRCENDNGAGNCEQWGGAFYPKCRNGFHFVGCCICSPDCPSGMFDVGVSCQKQVQWRSITVPTACPAGKEYDAGLCYPQCKPGFVGSGPTCYGSCPAGFTDAGGTCHSPPYVIVKV